MDALQTRARAVCDRIVFTLLAHRVLVVGVDPNGVALGFKTDVMGASGCDKLGFCDPLPSQMLVRCSGRHVRDVGS